jgi:leucyl/phenylalanyl-tRNA--protein transferase
MARRKAREHDPFPWLPESADFPFPPVEDADTDGILCSGGNLSPGMLISAYRRGIFPWFSDGDPILWWSPDPRFVLFTEKLHISGSMRRLIGKERFRVSLDSAFGGVIRSCAESPRPGQNGTWITGGMIESYEELHRLGFAHSAEAWIGDRLVGGLYGVCLGSIFFGESMFSHESDASKAAFIPLVLRLRDEGFSIVDSQVYTAHLAGLGAEEIPRWRYLELLAGCLANPTRKGNWNTMFDGFPSSSAYDTMLRAKRQDCR